MSSHVVVTPPGLCRLHRRLRRRRRRTWAPPSHHLALSLQTLTHTSRPQDCTRGMVHRRLGMLLRMQMLVPIGRGTFLLFPLLRSPLSPRPLQPLPRNGTTDNGALLEQHTASLLRDPRARGALP